MSKNKTDLKKGLIQLFLGLALVAGATFYWFNYMRTPSTAPEAETFPETPITRDAVEFDVQAALKDRILGDKDNAPMKISEHSSLSCAHCGEFHRNTFKAFKAAYIDTGKAYLVYSDFPLNAPALYGSMVARCMPEDIYFDFIQTLFEKQESWAFEADYMEKLKVQAKSFGMDNDTFEACVNNKELRDGMVKKSQANARQWRLKSTPSLVVNNQEVLVGAHPFDALDAKLKEISAQ